MSFDEKMMALAQEYYAQHSGSVPFQSSFAQLAEWAAREVEDEYRHNQKNTHAEEEK